VVLVLFSDPWREPIYPIGLIMRVLGWVSFLAGASLRVWSTLYLGGRKRTALVVEGPYSICRNPLYAATFMLALSAGLLLQSAIVVGASLVVLLGYARLTVPAEERILQRRFGSAYEAYCRAVPRFLPRLCVPTSSRWILVDTLALAKECKKAMGWLLIPILITLFDAVHLQPWWPHWFIFR